LVKDKEAFYAFQKQI